jgi:hypothetical protein
MGDDAGDATAVITTAQGISDVLAIDALEPRFTVLAASKGPFFTTIPFRGNGAIAADTLLILSTSERALAREAHQSLLAANESRRAIQATGAILW